jgi:hypothetical protein
MATSSALVAPSPEVRPFAALWRETQIDIAVPLEPMPSRQGV